MCSWSDWDTYCRISLNTTSLNSTQASTPNDSEKKCSDASKGLVTSIIIATVTLFLKFKAACTRMNSSTDNGQEKTTGIITACIPIITIGTALGQYREVCVEDLKQYVVVSDVSLGPGYILFLLALLVNVATFFVNLITPVPADAAPSCSDGAADDGVNMDGKSAVTSMV